MSIFSDFAVECGKDDITYINIPNEHFLTRYFREADPLIKNFTYDLSYLDKEDLPQFIRTVFEPELEEVLRYGHIYNIYIHQDLFSLIQLFKRFNPKEIFASDYYCAGIIDGCTQVQVCHEPFF